VNEGVKARPGKLHRLASKIRERHPRVWMAEANVICPELRFPLRDGDDFRWVVLEPEVDALVLQADISASVSMARQYDFWYREFRDQAAADAEQWILDVVSRETRIHQVVGPRRCDLVLETLREGWVEEHRMSYDRESSNVPLISGLRRTFTARGLG